MPTTDTNVPQVVVNKLTKAQYDAATKSPTEFYAVTDATISYNDLSDKPTIPTVNNATLTITQNNVSAGTFTANQSADATIALTDTTYSAFTGASAGSTGTTGLVPAPSAGDQDKYLKGDGTWAAVQSGSSYTAGNGISIDANNEISVDTTVVATQTDLAGKQDTLTPGSNISITNNTISATDTTYSNFTGATSSTAGAAGLVPAPSAGDQDKVLHGDGTWDDATAKLVEMSYGESNAWAKFIAAYNAGSIVYCRASSSANPASGSQTRKAFMAYVNNATTPTSVEFQYVRSVSSKTASQPVDQVFVYTLTNASGGTWSVTTRDMGPKLAQGSNVTVSYSSGTYTISATGGGGGGVNVVQTTGQSTTDVMSQKAVTDIIGNVETILQTLNSGNGAQ